MYKRGESQHNKQHASTQDYLCALITTLISAASEPWWDQKQNIHTK